MFTSFCLISSAIKIDLFFHLRKIISVVLEDEIILKIRIRILNKKMEQSFLKSVIPQEPQASSPFWTATAGSLQSWDRRVRPRLV